MRWVAYLDILGWKELVEKSRSNSKLIEKLTYIATEFPKQRPENSHYFAPHVTQFSDSIVVSIPADGQLHQARDLLLNRLFMFWKNLLCEEIFIRGGITIGEMYHRGDVAIGPALIEAYLLESRKAIYPRILISDAAATHIGEAGTDFDGNIIWDVLRTHEYKGPARLPDQDNFFDAAVFLPEIRAAITRKLMAERQQRSSVSHTGLEKAQWYASYYNWTVSALTKAVDDYLAWAENIEECRSRVEYIKQRRGELQHIVI